jgi:deoxyribonuclease IV
MLTGMRIGAHVPPSDPLAEAAARNADCVQLFLGNPQSWKAPKPRDDAAALRASPLPIYVHAPYLVNVASGNNRVRIPSRKILQQTCDAAAAIGAAGVIVHGGHVDTGTALDEGFRNWVKALERVDSDVPLVLENTAGGQHAIARSVEAIGRLWEWIGDFGIGFCLDTCHAHAAGEELVDVVERVRATTGRIDLVHVNDSKDGHGSGRDRHENLGAGRIDPDLLVEIVHAAGATAICETPGGATEQAADIRWLRERLAAGQPPG